MPKTTRENIAKIVYDSLVSSELEAIDELNSTITSLTEAINNLTQVLATKKEPVQLEMFAKIEPKVEIETQKEEPKPVKEKAKKSVKVYVQPVAEPVVEPAAEPVVETIPEEIEKPEIVEIESFADLQKKMTEELTGDFADKGAELIKKVLSFYKASKLREVPEDKYSEFYAKYQELKQE
jgi:nucleoid DNA-binding protein